MRQKVKETDKEEKRKTDTMILIGIKGEKEREKNEEMTYTKQ